MLLRSITKSILLGLCDVHICQSLLMQSVHHFCPINSRPSRHMYYVLYILHHVYYFCLLNLRPPSHASTTPPTHSPALSVISHALDSRTPSLRTSCHPVMRARHDEQTFRRSRKCLTDRMTTHLPIDHLSICTQFGMEVPTELDEAFAVPQKLNDHAPFH